MIDLLTKIIESPSKSNIRVNITNLGKKQYELNLLEQKSNSFMESQCGREGIIIQVVLKVPPLIATPNF
jgi:hypothetical protein